MTAKEAWNLIEPYINPMNNPQFNNKEMSEAFILCYIAMKEMGERESKENQNNT